MVRIAIAGGSGNVGQEIIDALVERKRHEMVILSRKDAPADLAPGMEWSKINYDDVAQLTKILKGVHTVLCFIAGSGDSGYLPQKHLIDASIQAGVKRFAPSEWATAGLDNTPWYISKAKIRKYLADVNKDKQVLEYTLFQPGLFTNYFTFPFPSSEHVDLFEMPINFHQHRALVTETYETDTLTLTTAKDTANVVALALEHEGTWPTVSGIKGTDISVASLIRLGEKIRGQAFSVEKLKIDDLKAGVCKTSWFPEVTHPAIPVDQREALATTLLSGVLLTQTAGDFQVSDEWNKLLPEYKFEKAEDFLRETWSAIGAGKIARK